MENTQIFEIVKIRRESKEGYAVVDYNLEGIKKNKLATYWELVNLEGFKKTREDINSLSDEEITGMLRKFLFEFEKVAMIIENRKLRDRLEEMEMKIQVHYNCLGIQLHHMNTLKDEAPNILTNQRHLGQNIVCTVVINELQDHMDHIEKNFPVRTFKYENRKSV